MTSQVVFTVDTELKKQTMANVKKAGIPLKSLLTYCMKAFNSGKIDLGININENRDTEYTEKNHKARFQAKKDLKEGKNIISLDDLAKKYS